MGLLGIYLFIGFGVIALYVGAELLVLFASKLALSWGLTKLMVGLTIVALCTSMPELVSSLLAVTQGHSPDMAFGNVIGSNIANIGLILGALAMLRPIPIHSNVVRFEAPLGVFLVIAIWLMMLSGFFYRLFGVVLVIGLMAYLSWHIHQANRAQKEQTNSLNLSLTKKFWTFFLVLLGAAITIVGGYLFIEGALHLADYYQLSSRFIGLTVVAVGSSLPEFAASFVALVRKSPELAIGNLYGSNIINILLVLGVVILVKPFAFSKLFLMRDLPILLGFAFLAWILALKKHQINRLSGLLLFCGYIAYLIWGI